jgi:hypothetical protein
MHRYLLLLCLLSPFALAGGPATEATFNAAVRAAAKTVRRSQPGKG